MAEWFASGRAVDAVLALVALEAAVLVWWARSRRATGAASAGALLAFLVAGACLLLALRAALVGASWVWVAAALAGAGAAHVFDLRARLSGAGGSDRQANTS